MTTRPFVVAGNGPSITEIPAGVIQPDDFIIRVNNFFFEPKFYVGDRVDLAFMAGDPRVAPFMFETLYQCRQDYDVQAWTSHNPKVVRAGQRRFADSYQPMRYRDAATEAAVVALITRYNRHPTSGVYAVLAAHALGAEEVILAGVDFYDGPRRYPYDLGPNYRALMGQDLGARGLDEHLHDVQLDLAILRYLTEKGGVRLLCAAPVPAVLSDLAKPAQPRGLSLQADEYLDPNKGKGAGFSVGRRAAPLTRNAPSDWVARSGLYPIALLKFLRWGSALFRKLKKGI